MTREEREKVRLEAAASTRLRAAERLLRDAMSDLAALDLEAAEKGTREALVFVLAALVVVEA